jgi:hypothetical protein
MITMSSIARTKMHEIVFVRNMYGRKAHQATYRVKVPSLIDGLRVRTRAGEFLCVKNPIWDEASLDYRCLVEDVSFFVMAKAGAPVTELEGEQDEQEAIARHIENGWEVEERDGRLKSETARTEMRDKHARVEKWFNNFGCRLLKREASDGISGLLDRIADTDFSMSDEVVHGCTYEELIGILIDAYNAIEHGDDSWFAPEQEESPEQDESHRLDCSHIEV